MYPQEPSPAGPTDIKHPIRNPLSVMQPGEQIICQVKRHPIGIFGIYFGAGLLMIMLAVLSFVVAPKVFTSIDQGEIMAIGAMIFIILSTLCLVFVFISNKIYWGNDWIVTSDSLTQTTQTGLFDKQSSQLSLGNLEDVTAEQNGPLTHMFNYGVIKIETAGESGKFIFQYCPNPDYYARQILNARERFRQNRGNENSSQPPHNEQDYPAQAAAPQPPPIAPPISQAPPEPGYGAYVPPPPSPEPSLAPDYPQSTTGNDINISAE